MKNPHAFRPGSVNRPESMSKQRFPQVYVKHECLAVPPAESATLRRNKVRILASNTSEVQGLLIQSSAAASKKATTSASEWFPVSIRIDLG